jgi:hypothetical protein
MKSIKLFLTIGNIVFLLFSLFMAFNFFLEAKQEQTIICLFLSVVSFILFLQLTKK